MFELSWGHIIVVAVVAIVVVGPKDLPRMLRALGQTLAKLRRMAGEFQRQFNEALREAELEDVKKSIESIRDLNPARQIRDAIDQSIQDLDRQPPGQPGRATPAGEHALAGERSAAAPAATPVDAVPASAAPEALPPAAAPEPPRAPSRPPDGAAAPTSPAHVGPVETQRAES